VIFQDLTPVFWPHSF